jgi:hypothetical protein
MKVLGFTLFLIFFTIQSGKVYSQVKDTIPEPDTTTYVKYKSKDPRPRRAAIRSAIIPGWGQFYNGKKSYWKIPIIYGAGGIITYFLITNNNTYQENKKLYNTATDPLTQQTARINRDNFRNFRDWNIAMLVGLYILNIVDANVTAHLKEFDVSESLTFTIKPYIYPSQFNYKPVAGIGLNLKFKK